MSEKQEGLIQKELDKIFAESKTAPDIGKLNALFTAEQQIKIYQLVAAAKTDFEELQNVRLFNLKYGPSDIALWNHQTLEDLAQLYQVKTIEKIEKLFGDPQT